MSRIIFKVLRSNMLLYVIVQKVKNSTFYFDRFCDVFLPTTPRRGLLIVEKDILFPVNMFVSCTNMVDIIVQIMLLCICKWMLRGVTCRTVRIILIFDNWICFMLYVVAMLGMVNDMAIMILIDDYENTYIYTNNAIIKNVDNINSYFTPCERCGRIVTCKHAVDGVCDHCRK